MWSPRLTNHNRAMRTRLGTYRRVVRGLTEGRVTLNVEALEVVVVLEVLEYERGLVRGLGDDVGVPVYFTPGAGENED